MIPLQLTLKNFLSYRDATLDFRGLHAACICGANGAGKSSLLEAIAWSLWGEGRAATDDQLIHGSNREVRVDFVFQKDGQTYRVIRSHQRGQTTCLEFQVQTQTGFRVLTERGKRATQQAIVQCLKLDYETFVNSAYLRQGKADEFMLKRPTERKQILASLLRLDRYDELAEGAKERSRQFKAQVDLLQPNLQGMQTQLNSQEKIARDLVNLEEAIARLHSSQKIAGQQLQSWQVLSHQQQTQQQQLDWHRSQHQHLTQDCQRIETELSTASGQLREVETLLQQEKAIANAHARFQYLQTREETLAAKFTAHQTAREQLQALLSAKAERVSELQKQLRLHQARLEALCQQEGELQQTLDRQGEVEAGLETLRQARDRLAYYDRIQLQVAPLLQRRLQLHSQIDRSHARLTAKLEEIRASHEQLQRERARSPQLQTAAREIADRIQQLENKRIYQQRVLEKGQERRHFMERLQANQRNYEVQLAEINQKIQMLDRGMAADEVADGDGVADASDSSRSPSPDRQLPPCPLCDRPLDEHHWNLVQQKHQTQQQEILNQLWVVREQLATSEREIQVFRQEYRDLNHQLSELTPALEKRGQLQAQLDFTSEISIRLQKLSAEAANLENSLQTGDYAAQFFAELRLLEERLQQLHYDEKDHALARGRVDRWRWAEIKQAEIKTAIKRRAQIDAQRPELETEISQLNGQLEQFQTNSQLQQQIEALERRLVEIGYDIEEHNDIRNALRQGQSAQFRYQQLLHAKQQHPQLVNATRELVSRQQGREREREAIASQLDRLTQQLAQNPDANAGITTLERQLQQQREQLDECLANKGRLQQQQQHLETLKNQYAVQQQQLQTAQRNYRVYQELSRAFGKKGIQSLMIENILPQLEAETNSLLARLSGNQLHVQFVTQKVGRSDKEKLIDTLDILIADDRGTRAYETYSGGEAFRINFAIRLAIARLLAQRAGTSLQMLIIDEGFGTQDTEGCERLVAAINAIASDFACILTITHMPYFKEAFPSRIEVCKTREGSQLTLSI